jgi:hypothetical protein
MMDGAWVADDSRVTLRIRSSPTEASMRKVFILALIVAACAKKEPAPDTTTPAPPPPPPPPPSLTAADVAGTWNGTSKVEGDTATTAFMVKSTSDSTATLTNPKTKVTVAVSTKLDADSMIATSKPYKDPTIPKVKGNVMFRAVGRMKDGKMVGTTTIVLASKPDSVVAKANWEATKAP